VATRGFSGRGRRTHAEQVGRLPPGQYLTPLFPVLSAGPTPEVAREKWKFELRVGPRPIKSWSWADFIRLPVTSITRDIHCVTKWSKFDTAWEGVTIDAVLADAGLEPPTDFLLAHSYDGYSTNIPAQDVLSGRGMKESADADAVREGGDADDAARRQAPRLPRRPREAAPASA